LTDRSTRSNQATTAGQGPRPVSRELTSSVPATTETQDWLDDREAETIALETLSPLPKSTNRPRRRSANTSRTYGGPLPHASVSKGTQYSGPATAKVPERFHNGGQRRRLPPPKSHEFAGLSTPGVPSMLPLPSGDRPRPDSSVFGGEVRYGDSLTEGGDGPLETFDAYFEGNGTESGLPAPRSSYLRPPSNYSRLIIPTSGPRATHASTADGNSPQLPPPASLNVRPNESP